MTEPLEPELRRLTSGAVVSRWSPPDPRSVVVLQHGFGEHVGRFVTQHHQLVVHLLAEGHEVWGMDLLGHGRSPGRRAVTDVRQAVDDHRQVRDLATTSKLPTFLVGHSLGGLVTAASAATDTSGVDGIVLLSPALPAPPPPLARRALLTLGRMAPAVRLTPLAQPLSRLSRAPGHEAATRADPMMDTGALTVGTGATSLAVAAGLWARLATWTTPTLVLHGTCDRHTAPADSRRFVDAIGHDNVEMQLVEGGLHELLADRDGDDVLDTVLSRLRTRPPAAGPATPPSDPRTVARRRTS